MFNAKQYESGEYFEHENNTCYTLYRLPKGSMKLKITYGKVGVKCELETADEGENLFGKPDFLNVLDDCIGIGPVETDEVCIAESFIPRDVLKEVYQNYSFAKMLFEHKKQ